MAAIAWLAFVAPTQARLVPQTPKPGAPPPVRAWYPGARLHASGLASRAGFQWVLPSCAVAIAFRASLPDASSAAAAWEPWREYVAELYGADAVGRISVRRLTAFHSLTVNASGAAAHERPAIARGAETSGLLCSHRLFFNAPTVAKGRPSRSIYTYRYRVDKTGRRLEWPGAAGVRVIRAREEEGQAVQAGEWGARRAFGSARAHGADEATRSGLVEVEHEWPLLYPEGVGYGCWSFVAVGTGVRVPLGRTLAIERDLAQHQLNMVASGVSADGEPLLPLMPAGSLHPGRLTHFCAWVPPARELSSHPVVSLGTTAAFDPTMRARRDLWETAGAELCNRSAAVRGALGRLRGAGRGRVMLLPALDGAIALNALARGYDSVQLSSVQGYGVTEVVHTRGGCVYGERHLGACLPDSLGALAPGAPGSEPRPCTCAQPAPEARSPTALGRGGEVYFVHDDDRRRRVPDDYEHVMRCNVTEQSGSTARPAPPAQPRPRRLD